jgi:hypothetical protein
MRGGSPLRSLFGLTLGIGLALSAGSARAQEAPAEERAPLKVAVVVAGDPDALLVDAAAQVQAALAATESLVLPSDQALGAALVGAPAPAADDGLGEARAARRRLGLGGAAEQPALAKLGGLTGAVALVLVRRTPDPSIEVYDVARGAYFEGKLEVAGAEPQSIGRFVRRRAHAARAHIGEPIVTSPPPPPAPETAEAIMPRTAAEAATSAAPGEDAEAPPRAPWIRRNWPYFVVGALLAGAVTFIVVSRNGDDPQPVVRIRPGGS